MKWPEPLYTLFHKMWTRDVGRDGYDKKEWRALEKAIVAIAGALSHAEPLILPCPKCGRLHVDGGEWATKPHRTHLCVGCGTTWRAFEHHTVGIAPDTFALDPTICQRSSERPHDSAQATPGTATVQERPGGSREVPGASPGAGSTEVWVIEETSRRWGECAIFWRPNRMGYTPILVEAGHYTKEEADDIHRGGGGEDVPRRLSDVEPLVRGMVDRDALHRALGNK